jgi:3-hydroxybutyryl-CoA dehydratase
MEEIGMLSAINIGDVFTSSKKITEHDVKTFADLSGDHNPLHLDAKFASTSMFKQRVAHGMLTASLISAALSSITGTVILTYVCFSFEKPVYMGDTLTARVVVVNVEGSKVNLNAEVLRGTERVLSGTVKILRK